jgi:hypothetical protein
MLLSTIVSAQSFSTVYHNVNYLGGSGRSVFEVPDGYLFFSVEWASDSSVGALYTKLIDINGSLLELHEFPRTRNSDPGLIDPIWANADGTFTAAITSFGQAGLDSIFLYHFDAVGDTLSTHLVSAEESQGVRDCVGTPDGGYLIAGVCTLTADPVDDCACIRKVTAQGEELWRRTWPQYQYIHSIRPMSGGSYLLGGNRPNMFDPACMIKVDGSGEQQWIRFTGGNAGGGSVQAIELPNSNYMIPNAWLPADSTPVGLVRFATALCIDPGGNEVWHRKLHYELGAAAALACNMDDDEFFVVGGYEQTPRDPDIATTLWRMNLDGDTLYRRKYWYYGGYAAENVATYGINRTSDGGLIMTGAVRQPINGEQPLLYSTWILKLDQYGCLTPGCQNVGVADYEMALQSALVLAPNPASDRLSITLPLPTGYTVQGAVQVVLLDAQGKQVLQKSFASAATELCTTLALEGLSPGMYYLHVRDELKWLAGGKVVHSP